VKILSLRFVQPITLHGISTSQTMTIEPGAAGPFKDWRVHVKGARVFLCSPRGWSPGQGSTRDVVSPRRMFDIPREACVIQWEGTEGDLENMAKWSPPAEPVPRKASRPLPAQEAAVEDADPAAQDLPADASPAPPAPAEATSDEPQVAGDDEEIDDELEYKQRAQGVIAPPAPRRGTRKNV
jgi:hypothetical protein